jgi:hypothetical protein
LEEGTSLLASSPLVVAWANPKVVIAILGSAFMALQIGIRPMQGAGHLLASSWLQHSAALQMHKDGDASMSQAGCGWLGLP